MKKTPETKETLNTVSPPDFNAESKLMKAAQMFSIAFDQSRRFSTDEQRLDFTISVWKELARAALEYSKTVSFSQTTQTEQAA